MSLKRLILNESILVSGNIYICFNVLSVSLVGLNTHITSERFRLHHSASDYFK